MPELGGACCCVPVELGEPAGVVLEEGEPDGLVCGVVDGLELEGVVWFVVVDGEADPVDGF
jgi:hypothetical protein